MSAESDYLQAALVALQQKASLGANNPLALKDAREAISLGTFCSGIEAVAALHSLTRLGWVVENRTEYTVRRYGVVAAADVTMLGMRRTPYEELQRLLQSDGGEVPAYELRQWAARTVGDGDLWEYRLGREVVVRLDIASIDETDVVLAEFIPYRPELADAATQPTAQISRIPTKTFYLLVARGIIRLESAAYRRQAPPATK